jgi:hypothetical protein
MSTEPGKSGSFIFHGFSPQGCGERKEGVRAFVFLKS